MVLHYSVARRISVFSYTFVFIKDTTWERIKFKFIICYSKKYYNSNQIILLYIVGNHELRTWNRTLGGYLTESGHVRYPRLSLGLFSSLLSLRTSYNSYHRHVNRQHQGTRYFSKFFFYFLCSISAVTCIKCLWSTWEWSSEKKQ